MVNKIDFNRESLLHFLRLFAPFGYLGRLETLHFQDLWFDINPNFSSIDILQCIYIMCLSYIDVK